MRCLIIFGKSFNTLWNELTPYFQHHVGLKPLNLQRDTFSLLSMDDENLLSKELFSIFYYFFKMLVYNSLCPTRIILIVFLIKVSKIKHMENIAPSNNKSKPKNYQKMVFLLKILCNISNF